MIVSKGEVVAYKWGNDCITTAEIEIPMNVGRFTEHAREYEKRYLELQGPKMNRRYHNTCYCGRTSFCSGKFDDKA